MTINKLVFVLRHSLVATQYTSNIQRVFISQITNNFKRTMSASPILKKARIEKKIGTHNGVFHCDEVLACFMLKQLPAYKDAEIIRTRDPALLASCDIVVDVGGQYDPAKHRYDHHQRSFSESMNSLNPEKKWVTRLSSAGLVYFHFGRQVLSQILDMHTDNPVLETIYDKVYELFVEAVDANDNGIQVADGELRYAVTTSLSSRVSHLFPRWNEEGVDIQCRFEKALLLVGAEFLDRVQYYQLSWLPARDLIETAIKDRYQVDASGEIMCLAQGGCPWKDHLFTLEEEMTINPLIKFVLFTDLSGKWRVQCVSVSLGSFKNRLSLVEDWRGVRDTDLSEKTGIPGCIFVHANGFIGGNDTYDGVLEMARQTLKHRDLEINSHLDSIDSTGDK